MPPLPPPPSRQPRIAPAVRDAQMPKPHGKRGHQAARKRSFLMQQKILESTHAMAHTVRNVLSTRHSPSHPVRRPASRHPGGCGSLFAARTPSESHPVHPGPPLRPPGTASPALAIRPAPPAAIPPAARKHRDAPARRQPRPLRLRSAHPPCRSASAEPRTSDRLQPLARMPPDPRRPPGRRRAPPRHWPQLTPPSCPRLPAQPMRQSAPRTAPRRVPNHADKITRTK